VKVSVEADDNLQKTGTTVGEFTMLSSKVMFVGGRPRTTHVEQLAPATSYNFKGCLKQVGFLLYLVIIFLLNNIWKQEALLSQKSCAMLRVCQ